MRNITIKRRNAKTKWIGAALAVLLIGCNFIAPATTLAAQGEDVVRVGWVSHPGLQDVNDGVYSGYTYDYLMKVADHTGWTYEFVPGTLVDTLARLESGEVDIMGGLIYSEERAQTYDMAQNEYGQSYISLFTSLNSELEAYDYDSFNGLRVGVTENATVNLEKFKALRRKTALPIPRCRIPTVPALTPR